MEQQVVTATREVNLVDLGNRWMAGESIINIARDAGKSWQALHGDLTRLGFKAGNRVVVAKTTSQPRVASKHSRKFEARRMAKIARKVIRQELARPTSEVHVIWPDETRSRVEGKPHAKFERCLQLAACRKNILLVGPAGCGKTHLAEMVAKALGLSFSFISCTAGMSEGQLMGRLVPTGEKGKFEYLRSDFVKAYEEGGVFLFDEIDAADSNTLLVINAALANGHMAVPNRPEKPVAKKHPDFICIAAANTFGTGADRQYVGRNQLDESTLDRFRIGQVEMDYDAEVEAALCPDDELLHRLLTYRQRAREARVRRVVSMRFLRDAYQMKQVGWTDADIDEALMSGWSADEVSKVKGH